jgi:hypothetical protein
VTTSVPAARDDVLSVATPEARLAVPRTAPPLENVMLPAGVLLPLVGFTVAVKVTEEPSERFSDDANRVVVVPTTAALTATDTGLDVDGLNDFVPA